MAVVVNAEVLVGSGGPVVVEHRQLRVGPGKRITSRCICTLTGYKVSTNVPERSIRLRDRRCMIDSKLLDAFIHYRCALYSLWRCRVFRRDRDANRYLIRRVIFGTLYCSVVS